MARTSTAATSTAAMAVLERELGAAAPDGFAALDDDELDALAVALRDAKRRQARDLEHGMEEALEIVPRLARGPVRKILFG